MKLSELLFHRRFSVNLYRKLHLPLGAMSMDKDWANDHRGDPYPRLLCQGDMEEKVGGGRYTLTCHSQGEVCRLLGRFFPWATYQLQLEELTSTAEVGLCLQGPAGEMSLGITQRGVTLCYGEGREHLAVTIAPGATVALTFRGSGVTVYLDGKRLLDRSLSLLDGYRVEEAFGNGIMALSVRLADGADRVCLREVEYYLCGGISHADLRPVCYEDGTPVMEGGRIFLTVSSRLEEGAYQSVLSWNPTLCDFRMEGAIFFEHGDGLWCGDVASSLVFDRPSGRWLIWMASFSHGHVLSRGECLGDPRFGIQLVRVRPMAAPVGEDRRQFAAFPGDEDPALIYLDGQWHLAICRTEPDGYHYYHFVSDDPLDGFTYVDRTPTGQKTGGSFLKAPEGYVFVCGSNFDRRARYEVYPAGDWSGGELLHCDYDDGGFRGWGSVMRLTLWGRERYVWITFDRHNGSDFPWSYGNIYVFDGDVPMA